MRFVGGPLHGQDIEFPDGPILYSHDDSGGVITYVMRTFGAPRQGGGWMIRVMLAPEVDRLSPHGQLAQLLDAFIADLPGACWKQGL